MSPPTDVTALVTGVTGQTGFYVAEQLAREGLRVVGLVRTVPEGPLPYEPRVGDVRDDALLRRLLAELRPREVYHFAALSSVARSWARPREVLEVNGLAVVALLEAVREVAPEARVLQAGSSEVFAGSGVSPQDETTEVRPRNPYGIAKAMALHAVDAWRRRHGLFGATAILYTHESPRRAPHFLFRKVTHGVAGIVAGRARRLTLGNLEAVRDWGYAPDFADATIRMLRAEAPADLVVATGEGHGVGELAERAFALVGLDWKDHVDVDPALVRPGEPGAMVGDPGRAARTVGWRPRLTFDGLLRTLLAHDLRALGLEVPFEVPEP